MNNDTIMLLPVAMRVPNDAGIYALSQLGGPKKITREEFCQFTGRCGQVSFCEDGISNPRSLYIFGHGMDAWYIIAEDNDPLAQNS